MRSSTYSSSRIDHDDINNYNLEIQKCFKAISTYFKELKIEIAQVIRKQLIDGTDPGDPFAEVRQKSEDDPFQILHRIFDSAGTSQFAENIANKLLADIHLAPDEGWLSASNSSQDFVSWPPPATSQRYWHGSVKPIAA